MLDSEVRLRELHLARTPTSVPTEEGRTPERSGELLGDTLEGNGRKHILITYPSGKVEFFLKKRGSFAASQFTHCGGFIRK